MSDPDRLIAGKYRVVRLIAAGGMGSVHEAVHVRTGGRVAIKVLGDDAQKDESARGRFAREARASGRLRSRFVARVLDVDALEDTTPYLVMEYLEGNDLARELKERGALPVEEVTAIVLQAAAGVGEAHANGIIHRDLKPGNVFLAREGANRVAKVLDFGISKVLVDADEELTRTFSTVGTPAYMSPEQIRTPKDVDSAADVWALGVLLYRMLAGRLPFTGNASSVAVSICSDVQVPLRTIRTEIPEDLEALVESALDKNRARRPTIAMLAETLQRHLGTGPEAALAREAAAEIAALQVPPQPLARATADSTIEPLRSTETADVETLAATSSGGLASPRARPRRTGVMVGAVSAVAILSAAIVVSRRSPPTLDRGPASTVVVVAPEPSAAAPTIATVTELIPTASTAPSASIAVPSSTPAAKVPVSPGKPKAPTNHAPAATMPARL